MKMFTYTNRLPLLARVAVLLIGSTIASQAVVTLAITASKDIGTGQALVTWTISGDLTGMTVANDNYTSNQAGTTPAESSFLSSTAFADGYTTTVSTPIRQFSFGNLTDTFITGDNVTIPLLTAPVASESTNLVWLQKVSNSDWRLNLARSLGTTGTINLSGSFLATQNFDASFAPNSYGTTSQVSTAGWNGTGAGNTLSFTAVPEPSAALLGGLGMLALLRRRRA